MYRKILVLLFVVFLVTSCSNEQQKEWVTTREGYKFWGYKHSKDAIYSWKGDTKGELIHNEGILEKYEQGRVYKMRINAQWGSTTEKDWREIPTGKYLGFYDEKPEGFGVLKIYDITSIGEFKKGELKGDILRFKGDNLLYRGAFKNGNYNGEGVLYEKGEIMAGEFEDGLLKTGIFEGIGNETSRLWNRVWGNKEEKKEKKEYYNLDRQEFISFIAEETEKYLQGFVEKTINERTDFWSWQPFRMFWQPIFTSRNNRINGWIEALQRNGVGIIDIEAFINIYITDYNENNIYGNYINPIKLKNCKSTDILDKETFDYINDLEVSKWEENFWFDFIIVWLVSFVIGFIIGFLFPPFFSILIYVDTVVAVLASIVGIVLSIFSDDIVKDIVTNIVNNYSKVLEIQDAFGQMLY